MKKATKKQVEKQLDYLKVVLLGQLTIEAIDSLRGTKKHRKEMRKITKLINKIATSDVDDLGSYRQV